MALVACYRDYHVLVLIVVRENTLEPVAQSHELFARRDLRLQKFRFHLHLCKAVVESCHSSSVLRSQQIIAVRTLRKNLLPKSYSKLDQLTSFRFCFR